MRAHMWKGDTTLAVFAPFLSFSLREARCTLIFALYIYIYITRMYEDKGSSQAFLYQVEATNPNALRSEFSTLLDDTL